MKLRRQQNFVKFLIAVLLLSPNAHAQQSELPDNYAESVMIVMLAPDASYEVSLRLARFPDNGTGTVWLHIADDNGAWSLADETFELDLGGATPVTEDEVSFSAHRESQWVRFTASRRHSGSLQGRVEGSFLASPTRHPDLGQGDVPVGLDLRFSAGSPGYRNQGRWEMTGEVVGTITVENQTAFRGTEGKWHEQTGPRAGFAPAFRYFNVQNEEVALLAIQYPLQNRFRGYAMLGQDIQELTAVSIDPPGETITIPRRFSVTLESGQVIEGEARVVQEWSVPIEGQRRPGSSVVADSNLGRLTGSLNDWEPAP